nr:MAG TPA: hypothetical protein [Caudoviricetes sp.]
MTACPFVAKAALYMERTADWTPVSPLTTVGMWHQALGEISEDVVRLEGRDEVRLRHVYARRIERRLVSVVTNATCFLRDLGVEDPAAAFVAEWERAAVKHPGMTLDCDGPTDELRFYALAEEVGEVAASLTYDNASGTGHNADTIAEVTQVGALALAWLTRYQDGENR